MNKEKKISISVLTLVILSLCLCVTGFAMGMVLYEVRNNDIRTGGIEIDLNGGKSIITEGDFLMEPGMTVERPFYVQNNGTWAVYYKLYFTGITGNLGDVLDVTLLNAEGKELLKGKLAELTKENVPVLEDELAVNERQELTVRFHFPKEEKNVYQGTGLAFELSAMAVQTKNNPEKEFD